MSLAQDRENVPARPASLGAAGACLALVLLVTVPATVVTLITVRQGPDALPLWQMYLLLAALVTWPPFMAGFYAWSNGLNVRVTAGLVLVPELLALLVIIVVRLVFFSAADDAEVARALVV